MLLQLPVRLMGVACALILFLTLALAIPGDSQTTLDEKFLVHSNESPNEASAKGNAEQVTETESEQINTVPEPPSPPAFMVSEESENPEHPVVTLDPIEEEEAPTGPDLGVELDVVPDPVPQVPSLEEFQEVRDAIANLRREALDQNAQLTGMVEGLRSDQRGIEAKLDALSNLVTTQQQATSEKTSSQESEPRTSSHQSERPISSPDMESIPPVEDENQPIRTERLADGETLHIQFKDAELPSVFSELGGLLGKNIVLSPEVRGTITLSLKMVTPKEALDAVLNSARLEVREREGGLFVSPIVTQPEIRKTSHRIYRPAHISAAELASLIEPLLSEDQGRLALPKQSEIEIVVVHDFEDVLDQVTELASSVDVPPIEIEFEITAIKILLDEHSPGGFDLNLLNPNSHESPDQAEEEDSELKSGRILGDAQAVLLALRAITTAEMTSRTRIRTLNGESVECELGKTRRTPSGEVRSGIQLRARPTLLNNDGLLRLEFEARYSRPGCAQCDEINTVSAKTRLLTVSRSPVYLAGVIEEEQRLIPCSPIKKGKGSYWPWSKKKGIAQSCWQTERHETLLVITPRIVDSNTTSQENASPPLTGAGRFDRALAEPVAPDLGALVRQENNPVPGLVEVVEPDEDQPSGSDSPTADEFPSEGTNNKFLFDSEGEPVPAEKGAPLPELETLLSKPSRTRIEGAITPSQDQEVSDSWERLPNALTLPSESDSKVHRLIIEPEPNPTKSRTKRRKPINNRPILIEPAR